MATEIKKVSYGQLMEMVKENRQPDEIRTATATYVWDGLNYFRRDGENIDSTNYTKSPLSKYSQKFLAGMVLEYDVPPVLDEKETEYLSNVIKPIRAHVTRIAKYTRASGDFEWIKIYGQGMELMFPDFKKGKMYKGMEDSRQYTLEELGL